MAGYKNALLGYDPCMFITFDGDAFDPVTRALISPTSTIMDETQYQNNGILHVDSTDYHNYRLGMPSCVETQTSDMYACAFGFYGHQPDAPSPWTKAFVEVLHQSQYNFGDNDHHGSYSVAFWVNKASDESHYRQVTGLNVTCNRTLVRKQGLFHIYYQDMWAGTDTLRVEYMGGTVLTWNIPNWFYGSNVFVGFTWDVTPEVGGYEATATLYVNGRIADRRVIFFGDTPPNTSVVSPVEIAGNISAGGNAMNDRATTSTMLDQIAMFDRALSQDELCRLYRLSKTYDAVVRDSRPLHHWSLADPESITDTTMQASVGSFNGVYQGGIERVLRGQAGPGNIGIGATRFLNGGMAAVHRTSGSGYTPLFNPTGDWTIHFWLLLENTDRSVILSLQRDDYPHGGILLEANRRNWADVSGAMQLTINDDYQISSEPGVLHTGWNHVCIARRGGDIEMYLNAHLLNSENAPIVNVPSPGPGQLYLMGMMPGRLHSRGVMSSVAIYDYALDPALITMFANYARVFRIRGNVTLQGTPHQANVRIMDHNNGRLMKEVISDANDGAYLAELYDDRKVDLLVLNRQDANIRYRAYGPIIPAEFPDT